MLYPVLIGDAVEDVAPKHCDDRGVATSVLGEVGERHTGDQRSGA